MIYVILSRPQPTHQVQWLRLPSLSGDNARWSWKLDKADFPRVNEPLRDFWDSHDLSIFYVLRLKVLPTLPDLPLQYQRGCQLCRISMAGARYQAI
jgi:hypothetical protein